MSMGTGTATAPYAILPPMTSTSAISLDQLWTYAIVSPVQQADKASPAGGPIASLMRWVPSAPPDETAIIRLEHHFDLEPLDYCAEYRLHIESAPGMVTPILNGRRLGTFDGRAPFEQVVTDAVWLEDNTIALEVRWADAARGRFGAITLRPTPCADPPG